MKAATIALAALTTAITLPAYAAQPVIGRWATVEAKAIVHIAQCGKSLCGKIEKILKPTPGRPNTDVENADPALRSRPLVGLPLLTGFGDAGSHWKGTIYDPESGKSYTSKISRNADGTLKVQGCIAFFCKTQTWTAVR
ncbi:MAG: DUF2147 domain-containing protein [Pseudomonadota bacterium]|uniref:DUF2147 domain-containing protein n=1 Tax=Sphingobium xenophagum TaxID=121428 RepID=A0A249MU88_SPHXE|nr:MULTISPECIES: DUF2147 domain-containing protein [Sphingobium]ASY44920.1 DUF2147 domain-containing protein [Sphingobium xenophagum]OUC54115.1 DUF2147 domain-containing protein [Sphingobium sp. GW456-12-10-14-TSB1]QWT14724.1 DUF2147 domain-containing protein [Sphingobium xenophagum]|tara:strand:- start:2930 stop:3346 length:417 start_codon:yes stop_codon:yes gene_type:complete